MSSSLTKGLRRSTSRSKAKPAAKSAKRAVKAKSPSKPKANRATAAKSSARTAGKPRPAKRLLRSPSPRPRPRQNRRRQHRSQQLAKPQPLRRSLSQGSKRRISKPRFELFDQRRIRHHRRDHRHRMGRPRSSRSSVRTGSLFAGVLLRRVINSEFW